MLVHAVDKMKIVEMMEVAMDSRSLRDASVEALWRSTMGVRSSVSSYGPTNCFFSSNARNHHSPVASLLNFSTQQLNSLARGVVGRYWRRRGGWSEVWESVNMSRGSDKLREVAKGDAH
jgi:hypothetical protein